MVIQQSELIRDASGAQQVCSAVSAAEFRMPRCDYRRKSDQISSGLQELARQAGFQDVTVETFVVRGAAAQLDQRLYRLNVPDAGQNRLLLRNFDLSDFRRKTSAHAFFSFDPLLFGSGAGIDRNFFDSNFRKGWLDPLHFKKDLPCQDLRHQPFISIDSGTVRDQNGPVYGDYDDCLFVQQKGSTFFLSGGIC